MASSDLYDGFGAGLDPPPGPFGFGAQFGYYTDAETSLILCGHRYYDPTTARWLTRDPIGYAGGMDFVNAYCGDRPVDTADPRGTDPIWPPSPQAARVAFSLFTGTMAVLQQVHGIMTAEPIKYGNPAPGQQIISRVESDPPEGEIGDGEIVTEGEPISGALEATGETGAADVVPAAAGTGVAVTGAVIVGTAAAVGWSSYEIYKYRPGHPSGPLTGAGEYWSDTTVGQWLTNGLSNL